MAGRIKKNSKIKVSTLPEEEPSTLDTDVLLDKGEKDNVIEVLPDEVKGYTVVPVEPELDEEDEANASKPVPFDPLKVYLREISRNLQLSREEEHELALKYTKEKDIEAAYRLVSSNLWLVVKIAKEYERTARQLMDLIQEGNIGLMEAVKSFDPYRGVRLPSYAVWWIRAYILRYLLANWRMVKIGTTQAQRKLFFNLTKEKERLEKEGFRPTPKLIAERLDVKEGEVVEMEQRLGSSDLSVDAPLQEDSDSNLLSILPDGALSVDELLSQKQTRALIQEAFIEFLTTLNEKEQAIFRERLLSEEKATLNDLASRFSLSKERIRQLEERIKEKLKTFLLDKFGTRLQDEGIKI